jgi:serine/threonine-protein phosphatase PP1 catalytic subunit
MGAGFSKAERRTVERLYASLVAWLPTATAPRFPFDREQLTLIAERSESAVSRDPSLLELRAPVRVVGDIHGHFRDLLRVFELAGPPPHSRYLFLGDYVDRGPNSLECIALLLSAKLLFPAHVFLLRGNHEAIDLCETGGFGEECKSRFDALLFHEFVAVFNRLPIAATINNSIFCVHGGISEGLRDLRSIRRLRRPLEVLENALLTDLLWADPSTDCPTWRLSPRGASQTYGRDAVAAFLTQTGLTMICRAHESVPEGIAFPFEPDRSVVTVFSCANYRERVENLGAVLCFDEALEWEVRYIVPDGYSGDLPGPQGRPPGGQ